MCARGGPASAQTVRLWTSLQDRRAQSDRAHATVCASLKARAVFPRGEMGAAPASAAPESQGGDQGAGDCDHGLDQCAAGCRTDHRRGRPCGGGAHEFLQTPPGRVSHMGASDLGRRRVERAPDANDADAWLCASAAMPNAAAPIAVVSARGAAPDKMQAAFAAERIGRRTLSRGHPLKRCHRISERH